MWDCVKEVEPELEWAESYSGHWTQDDKDRTVKIICKCLDICDSCDQLQDHDLARAPKIRAIKYAFTVFNTKLGRLLLSESESLRVTVSDKIMEFMKVLNSSVFNGIVDVIDTQVLLYQTYLFVVQENDSKIKG